MYRDKMLIIFLDLNKNQLTYEYNNSGNIIKKTYLGNFSKKHFDYDFILIEYIENNGGYCNRMKLKLGNIGCEHTKLQKKQYILKRDYKFDPDYILIAFLKGTKSFQSYINNIGTEKIESDKKMIKYFSKL